MTAKSYFIRLKLSVTAVVLAVVCVLTFSGEALAQSAEPYAVLGADGTLTFSYGEKPDEAYGLDHIDDNGTMLPRWTSQKTRIKKVVFDSSFDKARPTDCSYWFWGASNLQSIEGFNYFYTEQVTSMKRMFSNCSNLVSLNLSTFSTDNVTDMSSMFEGCNNLKSLDLSKFATRNVKDFSRMFYGCSSLTALDVSKFSTPVATNMAYMFYKCAKISSLDVSGFDTQNVTSMKDLFSGCKALTALDVSGFNTRNVTNMSNMFYNCEKLASLDVSGFNTQNVTDMSFMFIFCKALTTLDVSGFNTLKVMNMRSMFSDCRGLTTLDISGFNTQNVMDMSYMFSYCEKLATIYVGGEFEVSAVTNSRCMFNRCMRLKGAAAYNKNNVTKEYANYVDGYFTKLVGTLGDAKIGAVGKSLTADSLNIAYGQDFVAYEPFHAMAASYCREVSGEKWGTLCLPFPVCQNEEECEFYSFVGINASNATVEVESYPAGTMIPAGTPVIFKMKDGYTALNLEAADVDVAQAPVAATEQGACVVGTFAKIDGEKADSILTNEVYVYAADKFGRPTLLDSPEVNAMGAYIKGTGDEAPLVLDFAISGGPSTSVTDITAAPDTAAEEYYDVQGRRVDGLQRGVNIVKKGAKAYKVIVK